MTGYNRQEGEAPLQYSAPITIVFAAGVALLVIAALHDFGFRTVPNPLPVALLVCGLALRAFAGDLGWGVVAGLVVFILTAFSWRLGWMGGGDVKLLTACAVFVPPLLVPTLVLVTSISGGLLALVYLAGPHITPRPPLTRPSGLIRRAARCELWRLRRRGPLPYAAAIATGGVFAALTS